MAEKSLRLSIVRSTSAIRIAAVALFAGCLVPGAVAHGDPTPPSPGPAPGPANVGMDKDGTYAVGSDVAPGTYSSPGPVQGGVCYWKRVSGDKIVDNAMSKQPQIVQIEATDTSFKTSECQPWQKIDDCLPGCGPAPMNPVEILGQLGRIAAANPAPPPG